MAKINKVICDKCGKELRTDFYKINVTRGNREKEDWAIEYIKENRIDLCSDCYEKFKKFLGEK